MRGSGGSTTAADSCSPLATLPGSVAGALLVQHVPRTAFDGVMALVLASIGVVILIRPEPRTARQSGSPRTVVERGGHEWRYRVPMVRGTALSVLVGFLSSFLGIGGGVFHVPILVGLLGFPTHIATATSHFVLSIMSGGAVVTHALSGSYRVGRGLRRSIALAIGVAIGAQVRSTSLDPDQRRRDPAPARSRAAARRSTARARRVTVSSDARRR